MQQKLFSLTLSPSNARFIIEEKGGIRQIRITKISFAQAHDTAFWADVHLRVADQKELTLFDHSLSAYLSSESSTEEVMLNEQFGIIGHITVELYAKTAKEYEAEIQYELSFEE